MAVVIVMFTRKQVEHDAIGLLFSGNLSAENSCAHYLRVHAVVKFFRIYFECYQNYEGSNSMIKLPYRLNFQGLHLTACDIARSFCAGSITKCVLRNNKAASAAKTLISAFRLFGTCSNSAKVCEECFEDLKRPAIS